MYIGPKLYIGVSTAEDIQKVLTASKRRDWYITRPFRVVLGDGLVTSEGRRWKTHRRLIEPGFRREVNINNFIKVFNNGADSVCQHLAKTACLEQELYPVFLQETLQSILTVSFGVSIDDLIPEKEDRKRFANGISSGLKFIQERLFRPWLYPDWTLYFTENGRSLRNTGIKFRMAISRAVQRMSEESFNEENSIKCALRDFVAGGSTGNIPSDTDVFDEALTVAMAGSETTAATLCYALCALGLYPEWQERAVRELEDVYGTGDNYLRPSTAEDLSRLVVLESIIKETMRLFSLLPVVPHEVGEDVPLAGGQYVAPRGSSVFVCYCALHRQPDVFPDPEKFDPGRFLEGGSAVDRKPYSYLPFGGGPRICIGGRYSMTFMKMMMSAILRRFCLLPGSTREELEDIVVSMTGHPLTGYRAICQPRNI